MSDELSFGSRVDWWLLIPLLTVPAICVWVVANDWAGIIAGDWLLGVLLVLGFGLPLWVLVSLRYFLSDETIRVRCGPFHWQIPIRQITEVEATQSLASQPAMSLDRIKITYNASQTLMISPEPRAEFLRQLEYRRKQLAS